MHSGPSLTDYRNSRVILGHEKQRLGLYGTTSRVRLEDADKENWGGGGYSPSTGFFPKGKIHTSLKRMKSRCSLGWLATEKRWAEVQLCQACCVCQGARAEARGAVHPGLVEAGVTTGEGVAGSPSETWGLGPEGYSHQCVLLASPLPLRTQQHAEYFLFLVFQSLSILKILFGC